MRKIFCKGNYCRFLFSKIVFKTHFHLFRSNSLTQFLSFAKKLRDQIPILRRNLRAAVGLSKILADLILFCYRPFLSLPGMNRRRRGVGRPPTLTRATQWAYWQITGLWTGSSSIFVFALYPAWKTVPRLQITNVLNVGDCFVAGYLVVEMHVPGVMDLTVNKPNGLQGWHYGKG